MTQPPEDWTPSPEIAALSDEALLAHGRELLRDVIADIADHCRLSPSVAEQTLFGDIDQLDANALSDALQFSRDLLGFAYIGQSLEDAIIATHTIRSPRRKAQLDAWRAIPTTGN
jgi:hypothetical protein